jgi:2,3-bisphosphoglycerate-dependent phosphoglycerate mutase
MELLLVRHCRASGQAPEAPLTRDGALDAAALAPRLIALGADAAYSSAYARARETIAPFAAAAGLDLRTDARLRERAAAWFDDREAWLAHTRRCLEDRAFGAPGEESFAAAAARGLAALADIAAAGHRRAAIVSHSQLITSVLSSADSGFGFDQWLAMANPDLFLAAWRDGRIAGFERLSGIA